MVTGNWMDNDGLFRQYGTSKAVATTAGDYLSYGETRDVEFSLDLTTLTTTAAIVANTTFLGTNIFIESVQLDFETAAATGTSLSIGTMKMDRTTTVSDTNLVSALVTASMTAGAQITMTGGSTSAGALIGTTVTSSTFTDGAAYITAKIAGSTFTTGKAKIRIRYRGIGLITQ